MKNSTCDKSDSKIDDNSISVCCVSSPSGSLIPAHLQFGNYQKVALRTFVSMQLVTFLYN